MMKERFKLEIIDFTRNLIQLLIVALLLLSCKEDDKGVDIASRIVGMYQGEGKSAGVEFTEERVEIIKISNERVRVIPINQAFVQELEFDLLLNLDIVTSQANGSNLLVVNLDISPNAISISSPDRTFEGVRVQ